MAALDQRLVDAAIAMATKQWPTGEGGAAAAYTSTGRILTSVFVDSPLDSARLCHETGAICEAHRLDEAITASVCVHRESGDAPFLILPPCGLCVERLSFWGRAVQVAVPIAASSGAWAAKRLDELQPFCWWEAWTPAD